MKQSLLLAVAALALVGCSRQGLVTDPSQPNGKLVPVAFSVQRQNMTKATNLEAVNHYNFGVFAYKVNGSNSLADAEVMNNYLVGYSNGTDKGYDKTNATTYNPAAGTNKDHTSPWFYEGLGTAEYTYEGTDGFYKKDQTAYMSNNAHQYLRYWDLAYANTHFYAYAPYVKTDEAKGRKVSYDHTTSKLTFAKNTLRDGYDNPVNTAYDGFDRSLSEFMYAGVEAKNSDLADVTIPFKRMGAMALIRFYEDIPGYKVEIINLADDNGTVKTDTSDDMKKGIQLTPSVASTATPTTYTLGEYYTTSGAIVTFDEHAVASFTSDFTGSTKVSTPLMFAVPTTGLTTYNGHKVIKEKVTTGTQEYSASETAYYAVAQPTDTKTGFTIHVSYRIIAEDNQEVITVHNATVHVPYTETAWKANTKYTYTFKITKNTTGTTNPGGEIDPTDPTPSTTKSLYPIVFDNATIEEYAVEAPEMVVSENTNY
jgi:hypothetical protein